MLLNHLISAIVFVSLLAHATQGNTQQVSELTGTDHTRLYLPISRDQFPELISKLETALLDAGLDDLKLITGDYWHPYQNGVRQGRPGIYLAAPHFAAWLIDQHQFEPTLMLSESLQYVIVARRADLDIFEVNDLASKTVCTGPTMDLSFLLVQESMTRSLLSAETERVEDVANQMQTDNKRCDAFSLSEHLFKNYELEQPFKFIRLQQSAKFSNYAYLFHPSVSKRTKAALRKFLLSRNTQELMQPIYRLYAKQPIVVKAKPRHYPPAQSMSLRPYWGPPKSP